MKKPKQFQTTFFSYKTKKSIGEGGCGIVYEAYDDEDKKYAIKVLDPSKASNEKLKRFKNEYLFCNQNNHKNIINVLDHGITEDSCRFYVMPLYESSLRKAVGKIEPSIALNLFLLILDGVEAAHKLKVIHRDLKPENILIRDGMLDVVVADFGIADFSKEELYTAVETSDSTRLANFQYAAPEQRTRGENVDQRADIYALGLILNELITRKIPHGTNYKTIGSVVEEFEYLDSLVEKMLQQDPSDRFAEIDEIKKELIARGKGQASRQKLSELENKVIPINKKPPKGKKPFNQDSGGIKSNNEYTNVDSVAVEMENQNLYDFYKTAGDIIKSKDFILWKSKINDLKREIPDNLHSWRLKFENNHPNTNDELIDMAIEGLEVYLPIIYPALAGVESRDEQFIHQQEILGYIIATSKLKREGYETIVDLPLTVAFTFQALHGASCIASNQLNLAINLIKTPIILPNKSESKPLYLLDQLVGWPSTLARNSTISWKFLMTISNKFDSLKKIFGENYELEKYICSYYMLLNFFEFLEMLERGDDEQLIKSRSLQYYIPPNFTSVNHEIGNESYIKLIRNQNGIKQISTGMQVPNEKIKELWPVWIQHLNNECLKYFNYPFNYQIFHENLVKDVYS